MGVNISLRLSGVMPHGLDCISIGIFRFTFITLTCRIQMFVIAELRHYPILVPLLHFSVMQKLLELSTAQVSHLSFDADASSKQYPTNSSTLISILLSENTCLLPMSAQLCCPIKT